jgi:hypothetical protein
VLLCLIRKLEPEYSFSFVRYSVKTNKPSFSAEIKRLPEVVKLAFLYLKTQF